MQWYILQVYSGNEKKNESELQAQIEKKNMQNNIEKILIPSEDVKERKKGKKVRKELIMEFLILFMLVLYINAKILKECFSHLKN